MSLSNLCQNTHFLDKTNFDDTIEVMKNLSSLYSIMALNEQHFKNGLDQIGSTLRSNNKSTKVIDKAKHQLFDLFLDDNAGLTSHEEVEKAFDHVAELINSKSNNARRENMKPKWVDMKNFLGEMKIQYTKRERNKDIVATAEENKKYLENIRKLYDSIKEIENRSQKSNNNQSNNTPQNTTPIISNEKETQQQAIEAEKARIQAIIDPEEKKAAEIEFVMKNLFTGVGEAAANKIKEYADRIISGQETREKAIEGLSPSFVKGIDDLLAAQGRNEKKDETIQETQTENEINQKNENELQIVELKIGLDDNVQKLRKLLDGEFVDITETNTGKTFKIKLKKGRYLLANSEGTYAGDITTQELKDRFDFDVSLVDEIIKLRETRDNTHQAESNPKNNLPVVINNKSNLPPLIENNTTNPKQKPTLENTVEKTQNDLFGALNINANLMDKENLIYESERNRIRDKSERKYEAANRFKKIGMFATDRRSQRRDLKNSINNQTGVNNSFIEDTPRQNRINGMIGTYSQQTDMGMENLTVQKDTTALHNHNIDNIAHLYLSGARSREDTINAFNHAMQADPSLAINRMTGTDLMTQLENTANNPLTRINYIIQNSLITQCNQTYNNTRPLTLSDTDIATIHNTIIANSANNPELQHQIKNIPPDKIRRQFEEIKTQKLDQNISSINENSLRVRVNLFKITKTENTEELEGVKYDNLDKGIVAQLSKGIAKLGLPGSIAMKIATGAIITGTGGAPLYALGGVMAIGSIIQYLKTYRDSTREIAKTHEDAINLGLGELENRIHTLETEQQNAGVFARAGAIMGRNARNRRNKQIRILNAFREMRNHTNTIRPVQNIIDDLNAPTTPNITQQPEYIPQIMAEVLARIDTGHKYQTQFISTSDANGNSLGRQQTAIKRDEMMSALKQRAINTPLTLQAPDGTTTSLIVTDTSSPTDRTNYRNAIKTNPHYTDTRDYLSTNYESVIADVKSTRRGLGARAAGQYALNTAAAAILTGGIKSGLNSNDTIPTTTTTTTPTTQHIGDQSQFQLSQYENGTSTLPPQTESFSTLHNGDVIEQARAEVSVDAVAAKVGAFDNYQDIAHNIHTQIGSLGLHDTTQQTLQDALSTSKLDEIMRQAASAGADIGNQKLAALRWTNMIENFAKELHDNNLNEVIVKNIKRDESINQMAIQASKHGIHNADATHRGFTLIAEAVNTTSGETTIIPIHETIGSILPKEAYIAGVFPFFNTYAKPGNKKDERAETLYPPKNKKQKKDRPKNTIDRRDKQKKKVKEISIPNPIPEKRKDLRPKTNKDKEIPDGLSTENGLGMINIEDPHAIPTLTTNINTQYDAYTQSLNNTILQTKAMKKAFDRQQIDLKLLPTSDTIEKEKLMYEQDQIEKHINVFIQTLENIQKDRTTEEQQFKTTLQTRASNTTTNGTTEENKNTYQNIVKQLEKEKRIMSYHIQKYEDIVQKINTITKQHSNLSTI